MQWKDIKKIDAHVHVLPKEKLNMFKNYPEEPYSKASINNYVQLMQEYNIQKAILQPINDMYTYYDDADKTNSFHSEICKDDNRFIAFADILNTGAYFIEETPKILERAINEMGLKGLKIHPTNLHLDVNDLKMIPVLRKAAELNIPVMIHSNPSLLGFNDNCAPDKINKMIQVFPDINFITAHMGGMKFLDAISGCTYVDISYFLPKMVEMYGIEQSNRFLRMFGVERLIFGTDFPDCNPKLYCDILDQMDFTEEEMRKIAYQNIERLFTI